MIRDYKIKQQEWPIRTKRRRKPRGIWKIFGALVLVAAVAYGGIQWLLRTEPGSTTGVAETAATKTTTENANIIQLQLPPPRNTSFTSPETGAATQAAGDKSR